MGRMTGRLVAVDLARSLALCGMVVFHFTFDLELFGHLAPGTTITGKWAIFARVVAGSFLFLSGISLVLAHGDGVRWAAFGRRLAKVAAAAALVTVATRLALPEAFIFFGILHAIAFGSLLGILLIRLPGLALLAMAVAIVVVDRNFGFDALNGRALVWTGLGTRMPWTMDFVPVFPWAGALLAGMGAARLAERAGVWDWLRLQGEPEGTWVRRLAWPGRHSLAIYLVHQPVLIALVWLGTQAIG